MAVDAYVMPLWRFKADDFTSPIEKNLGVEPTVVSLEDPEPERPPWHLRLLARIGIIEFDESELPPEERRRRAVREVAALKRRVSKLAGTKVDWRDEGEVHYSEQFQGPEVLRAFALWCDRRDALPEFAPPPDHNYYEHAVWKLPDAGQLRFPTLVQHGFHTGYLFPVAFDGVHRVEPFTVMGGWEFHHHVASTQAVSREVEELLGSSQTLEGHPGEEQAPVRHARWLATELRQMCSLSLEHGLPVIFHG
jgi:hypothetical protein